LTVYTWDRFWDKVTVGALLIAELDDLWTKFVVPQNAESIKKTKVHEPCPFHLLFVIPQIYAALLILGI
jgi:hypothetical protein